MSKAQEALKLLNEELGERLKNTPHVLHLTANKEGEGEVAGATDAAESQQS